ncbi:hypothetical protein Tco_1087161 [Tanacetum coccineum]
MKDFLWSQSDESKGKAKVAWKSVCKPKNQGGLGLKDLMMWNKALFIKHLWNIANKKDTLWVKWVNTVKLKGVSVWVVQKEECDSWGWKNLLTIRDLIKSHILYKIGDGENTYIQSDESKGKAKVAWKSVCNLKIRYLRSSMGKKTVIWLDNNGNPKRFTMKNVYDDIREHIQERLLTHDRLKKWGSYDMMAYEEMVVTEGAAVPDGVVLETDIEERMWDYVCK